ncbi:MAG: hypothetical protein IJK22_07325 [Bacteroidales bacterium]|nr:hypothetical protein [Bacteroidales bacterium]
MNKKILRYIFVCVAVFAISAVFDLIAGGKTTEVVLKKAALYSISFTILWGLIVERNRKKQEEEVNENENEEITDSSDVSGSNTVEKMVELYGEPDATIVTDGTKGMAPDSTVLVYDHGGSDGNGFLVYDGLAIDKSSITDLTFHREERSPYGAHNFTFPELFEIILNTTDDNHPKVFVNAGHDLELAKETMLEIRKHLD